ncbi:Ribosomal protein S18 acetylase RimI [Virgibacillus subterraneus]|uniref:Ribosomal protein S18 acetylase RimI n=1 Tax=Virgibacillus subterraneus TaxID=621109 RepID=A0A1H9JUG9_9BACI|nr:GNAT family N-acetyltransferase [Virgibacillus subterraneus]SEQ90437.1 Ribosomal protein S18 acetylase RimI [Virgibacillus subterraneus]
MINNNMITPFGKKDEDLHSVAGLYCKTFIGDNYTSMDFENTVENINKHTSYEGFKGLKAKDESGTLIGFSYGYTSLLDQFYREKLAAQLTDQQQIEWLSDCFEFVELAVDTNVRRMGVGRKLHDRLLSEIDHDTSVLTTSVENNPAINLYISKGREVIKENAAVISMDDVQVIMGKRIYL